MSQSFLSGAWLAAACVFFSPSTSAQEAKTLDSVVVTANRVEQSSERTLNSVTVLERQDIEKSQAGDLLTLLSRQSGIDVSRNGGRGALSTVFMRGANSNHTLVLLNGVRLNATGQGLYDFSLIPLAQIERIEIVRGPRAALWGSDAIGGVIHIFTREPKQAFASALAGSQALGGLSAGTGFGSEHNQFGVAGSIERSNGINASTLSNWSYNPDRDGHRNRSISLNGKSRFADHRLSAFVLANDADVEFDQGETFGKNLSGGVTLASDRDAFWSHTLSAGYSRDELNTPAYGSGFDSQRISVDWIHGLNLNAENSLMLGLNWSEDRGESTSSFSGTVFDRSRENQAVFAQWLGQFADHQFELAARHDDNQQFGSANTAQAAWGWVINNQFRSRLSWGEGYRAPSFNELYSPGFGGFFSGNPALQPEQSETVEFGLNARLGQHNDLELSIYRSEVDELIAFNGINFQAINIQQAQLRGAELVLNSQMDSWELQTSLNWQQAENRSTGAPLLRRAPRKASFAAGYRFSNQALFGIDIQTVSQRQDFDGPLGGYTRVDLRSEWPLAGKLLLRGKIENLTDHDYQLASGFATPGRSFLVELIWNAAN